MTTFYPVILNEVKNLSHIDLPLSLKMTGMVKTHSTTDLIDSYQNDTKTPTMRRGLDGSRQNII